MNLNWQLMNNSTQIQSLSANASYQEAADKQGLYIMPGNLTRFINIGVNYGIDFTSMDLSMTAGVNFSNNYATRKNVFTLGPTFTCIKRLLNKAMTTGLTISMNRTQEEQRKLASIYNLRWNISYNFLKGHGVNAGITYQYRSLSIQSNNSSSITSQISYNYSF